MIQRHSHSLSSPAARHTVWPNWKSIPSNLCHPTKEYFCLTLEPRDTISLLGEYQLLVKKGFVQVCGAVLNPSSAKHLIFAPSSHAIPHIICCDEGKAEIEIWESDASIRSLSLISPLFRRLWNPQASSPTSSAAYENLHLGSFEEVRQSSSSLRNRSLRFLDINASWTGALETFISMTNTQDRRALVCGPKGSGKSTFCRLAANALWTLERTSDQDSVVIDWPSNFWLDLDPDQPEFTAPGQVSLLEIRKPILGPPFTQSLGKGFEAAHLLKGHFVGCSDVKEASGYYLKCVVDLLAYFKHQRAHVKRSTLIINCPGSVADSTMDLLIRLAKLSAPTKIFMMDVIHQDFPPSLKELTDRFSIEVLPCTPATGGSGRTAAELRTMQTISYFHQTAFDHGHASWAHSPIMEQEPCILKYGSEGDELGVIMFIGEFPPAEHICSTLEGRLVGISIFTGPIEMIQGQNLVRTKAEGIPLMPHDLSGQCEYLEPRYTQLIGLALLKKVDAKSKSLHIQIPRTFTFKEACQMVRVDKSKKFIVTAGTLDTPGWAYLENLYLLQATEPSLEMLDHSRGSIEDLSIDNSQVELVKVLSYMADQANDEQPWVRSLRSGESVGKRWRTRRDLGRSSSQSGISSTTHMS